MTTTRRFQLVLLGVGHGHIQVLRDWAMHMRKGVDLTVVEPAADFLYSARLADWVSGRRQLSQDQIAIEPWIRASGARWIRDRCVALDVNARTVTLRDATRKPLHFDWLSINTGASMGLQQLESLLPGAHGRVLPLRPLDRFMDYWAKALEAARLRSMSLAVIGGGLGGIELALAIQHRLHQTSAHASVTLLTGGAASLANTPRALIAALARARIQVLHQACSQVGQGELILDNGMRLACDLPIVTTGCLPPPWLADSGLRLDGHGYVAVNAHQQSTSHLRVFAVGDVATRVDRVQDKTAMNALHAGSGHAHTLWAAIQGLDLRARTAPSTTLQLINTSDGSATLSWRRIGASGRWVKAWKSRRDQAWIERLRAPQ